jgi:hypothetical protein
MRIGGAELGAQMLPPSLHAGVACGAQLAAGGGAAGASCPACLAASVPGGLSTAGTGSLCAAVMALAALRGVAVLWR